LIRIGALALTRRHQPFRASQLKRIQGVQTQSSKHGLFDETIFDKKEGQP
jgi:NADH-quinone oxidoreductase subunit A